MAPGERPAGSLVNLDEKPISNVTPLTSTTGTILLANGRQFLVNYADNAPLGDGGGNDVSLTLMAVPEPSTMSTLAASIGLALGLQRRRRRR